MPIVIQRFGGSFFISLCTLKAGLKVLLHAMDNSELLSKNVFEGRTSTGSEAFSLLIRPDATKCIFLSAFTIVETIPQKIYA